jgi:aspartyl-tRNA(Asn)/glutamyl-tRNA(Gln) amidotransferase subunit A
MSPADLSAEALLDHFARGTLTPVQALQSVTERIARDNAGINAFAVLDPRALLAAGDSAERWRADRPLGLLDGIPCTVKDLIDIAGLPTRKGSRTTDPAKAETDAPLVRNLKAAGAIIVGKTTTTEFGWKTPGDCPLHGITRNPRDRAHTPGGSSSGAAAAAAANFGPLHVGTDAGGGIRIPAAWCGVVGLKPTFGRIPQWPPAVPFSARVSVAVAGPITRTVRDSALLLSALARADARDPSCLPDDPRDGRPRDWRDGIAAVEQAAQILADHGAEIEAATSDRPDTSQLFTQLWSTALALVVADTPPDQRHLLDAGLRQVAARDALPATDLFQAITLQNQAANTMAHPHRRFDLILCPAVPSPPPRADADLPDPIAALNQHWAPWTYLFNLTRQPAITIPLGTGENGLPCSVQLAAAQYRDDLALRAARTIERAQSRDLPSEKAQ